MLGDFFGGFFFGIEGFFWVFFVEGLGDFFLLEVFLVVVFCLICLCDGDVEGFFLVVCDCWWVLGEVGEDCLVVWDLGLIFCLGEDDGDFFEVCDFEVFVGEGWGEVEVECFVWDLVLGLGEVEVFCVDFWFLGFKIN